MSKPKKPTRHQQRLHQQRSLARRKADAELRASALADLDAPVWDELDADLRTLIAADPFPWKTSEDLADAIVHIGETANPAELEARLVAVGLMDLLRAADDSSPAVIRELRAGFPAEALTNTNTFIAACAKVAGVLETR
ncbi:hypothetical protein [Salinispora mooreana]|uniref:hypothetical protein n=1 Tax=Salinispora mooreana TaxID=999545 RepID=UPI000367E593|nr:hypothetical protein [Salinispora mooreana]